MRICIGADFRGFEMKGEILEFLTKQGYTAQDMGAYEKIEGDDFNDPAIKVSEQVRENSDTYGILICGSGHGMTMQANRFNGIRATLCESEESADAARKSDDANVLCLSADRTDIETAKRIILKFLNTDFEPLERRIRRMNRLDEEGEYD